MIKRGFARLILVGWLVGGPLPALAEELVVAEGNGVALLVGQTIDGEQPLVLGPEQWVTLIAANGRIIKLRGPYQGTPAPGQPPAVDNSVIRSLRELTDPPKARADSLGAARTAGTGTAQPEPWLIDVAQSGTRCVLPGAPVILWRPRAATAATVDIVLADGTPVVDGGAWPAAADRVALPESFAIVDGQTYRISINGAPSVVTVFVVPKTVREPAARAAWLALRGCDLQARMVVEALGE